ncbi:MAG TPA: AarF/UbiB family protein, partial [Alphaproteobacteria bacterium]|nr:AarF/UbiB family protein [Alphaproteobacteria bacterium]
VKSDLSQLKLALSMYEGFFKTLETQNIFEEIQERLLEELDYEQEAKNCKIYGKIFKNTSDIIIPTVYDDLSTKRLLTMSWIDGKSLLAFENEPQELKDNIAVTLFKAWYYPLYNFGIIHGDPHPGNYLWTPDQKLALLDFGCVRYFPPSFIEAVIYLYQALLHKDQKKLCEAFERWGFKNLSQELIEAMSLWAQLLFEPLLEDKIRPLKTFEDGKKGWDIATKVHALLKKHGGVKPPKEFVFMDRSAVGIGSMIMKLNASHNWHQLFENLIEDFSPSKIEKNLENLN